MLFKTKTTGSSDPTPLKRAWFKKPGSDDADVTDVTVREVHGHSPEPASDTKAMLTPSSAESEYPAEPAVHAASRPATTPPDQAAPSPRAESASKHEKEGKRVRDETSRPVKILVGYLPNSTEKDTYHYMLSVAERNLDSESIGWAGLFKFEDGYAYEIHEGGNGRSYLESVLDHFRNLPPYLADEDLYVFVRTAQRTVRIERTKMGVYSVLLPENDLTPESACVAQGKKLAPLVDKRTWLFLSGLGLFVTSVILLAGTTITRYQPYTPGELKMDRVAVSDLPYSQWARVIAVPPNDYVTALRYANKKWTVETNLTGKSGMASPATKRSPVAGKPTVPDTAKPVSDASAPVPALPAPPKP